MNNKTELAAGDASPTIDTYTISALNQSERKNDGTRVLFFGAIHGNETCGPRALKKLVHELRTGELKVLKGSVMCVPIANPKAFEQGIRCCEDNLNRVFTRHPHPRTYEETLANILVSMVDQCDILVDFHSASAPTPPFVFLDYPTDAHKELVRATGVPNVLTGWAELYQRIQRDTDKPTHDTGRYAYENGKVSVTVECGTHTSPFAEGVAYQTALNVLQHFGIIKGEPVRCGEAGPRKFCLRDFWFKESATDTLIKEWESFEPVSQGQEIAKWRGGALLTAPYDGYVVLPKQNAKVGSEWFYLAKLGD